MGTELPDMFRKLRIIDQRHTAFSGRDGFSGMEADSGRIAETALMSFPDLRAQRTGGIFDDLQPISGSECVDRGDIGTETELIDRDDTAEAVSCFTVRWPDCSWPDGSPPGSQSRKWAG